MSADRWRDTLLRRLEGSPFADENSPAARKLAALIEQCEHTLRELRGNRPNLDWSYEKLRAAIEEARKP